jgi:hypothetical protein
MAARTYACVLAALALAASVSACGDDDSPTASSGGSSSAAAAPQHHKSVALRWTRCPNSGWAASVAGMSCRAAGKSISRHFLAYGETGLSRSIRLADPSGFHAAGFDCTQFPLVDGGGWHIVCAEGDRHISFFFTP